MHFNEFQGSISIKNTHEIYEEVKRFDIDNAKEGLGIYVIPNGTMHKQLTETLKKVNPWSDRIKNSYLTQKEAYMGAKNNNLQNDTIHPSCYIIL